jgi:hypothetical protein
MVAMEMATVVQLETGAMPIHERAGSVDLR